MEWIGKIINYLLFEKNYVWCHLKITNKLVQVSHFSWSNLDMQTHNQCSMAIYYFQKWIWGLRKYINFFVDKLIKIYIYICLDVWTIFWIWIQSIVGSNKCSGYNRGTSHQRFQVMKYIYKLQAIELKK